MLDRRSLLAASAGLLASRRPAKAFGKPDIVVVVLDDMRASDWRALPQTRKLVGGAMFDQFICTTPLCAPSRATLFSGRYAHNHCVLTNRPPDGGWGWFRDDEPGALPVALRRAGYRTALVGKYMNEWEGSDPPPGWDVWHGSGSVPRYAPRGEDSPYLPDRLGRTAAAVAGTDRDGPPLFLWYTPAAPHATGGGRPPVVAPRHRDAFPEVDNPFDRARLQSLLAVDEHVQWIAYAMGAGRFATACVFVLSDNGFELGDHGYEGKALPYDGVVRVPMLTRFPGIAGTNRLAATIDVAPTIARAAGTTLRGADGRPLQDDWDRDAVLLESWGNREQPVGFVGIRTRDTTYVERTDGGRERYDRTTDPGEQTNLIAGDEVVPEQSYLSALRGCAGDACRPSDAAPPVGA